MRNFNKKKIGIIILLIVAILAVGYKMVLAPTLYNKYMEEGNSCLTQKQYEQAIEAFDKAIKVKSKDTAARIQKSKAYVGKNEFQSAVEILEDAQNLDRKNEELLLEIIDIAVTIDGGTAYDFLDIFVQEVGEANLSTNIRNLLNSASESPKPAQMDISEGKYLSSICVKLNKDRMNIGHSYYYTINGDTPDQNSQKYMGNICISNTTTIKIIGYNKDGQSTEVVTLNYTIDQAILDEIKNNIEASKKLISETKTGTDVGSIPEKNKKELQSILDKAETFVNSESIKYDAACDINKEIENAIKQFKDNIVKPVDKSELKSYIDKAENLYNNSTEGSKTGQYKSGSKSNLKKYIDEANKVYSEKASTQEEVDSQVSKLKNAIDVFNQNKIKQTSSVEQKILGKYIVFNNDDAGLGICKFTKNELKCGYMASEGIDGRILSRRESGNTVYYTTPDGEITVQLLDNNTVNFGQTRCKLLNAYQLIGIVYDRWPDMANYDYLRYFGVSQSEIDYFYSH
ncbi:chitobiase/beta-hexosaminidase C-terminal domain-containing protein [Intestinibacter sp.]|uniref:chitobiase/beta-hexosaminidase C-terminal domain-containing protein n=1 Tax=Intestinibacter sp. TaxID=1965304 RepID=UPI003F17DFBC